MNPKTILLVEDNPSDVALTKRALERSHVANQVVVAEDGQDALDYLFCTGAHASRDPTEMPAVILLDLKLPKVDGFGVLRRLRSDDRTRRLPVVVLTSSSQDQDVAASYDLGVNSYMRKPVDFNQFAAAIQNVGLYWLVLNEPPPPATRPV